jgi:hypothetical protein
MQILNAFTWRVTLLTVVVVVVVVVVVYGTDKAMGRRSLHGKEFGIKPATPDGVQCAISSVYTRRVKPLTVVVVVVEDVVVVVGVWSAEQTRGWWSILVNARRVI